MDKLHLILPLPPELRAHPRLLPSLSKCLARGHTRAGPDGLSAALCQGWGLARQQDWPLAPLSAARDGLEPGEAYWLLLEPIHLEVGMHGLFPRDGLALSPLENRALAQALAPLFLEQGITFLAAGSGRWYLRFPSRPDLATTPLDRVLGRQAMHHLPTGADAPRLMRLVNAAQMLLHDHPLNQAREQAGALTANSLWPWGGGIRVGVAPRFSGAWGRHPSLLALAHASATPVHPCPARLQDLDLPARALVLLETLEAGNANDPEWLERDWLRPLLQRVRLGGIRHLELTVLDDASSQTRLRPWHAWRVWRGAGAAPEAGWERAG